MTKSRESKSTDTPPASPTRPGYLTVTEASMKDALIEARGDIFIASQLLNITAIRIHRAIEVSATLQAVIAEVKISGSSVSDEQIRRAADARAQLYRVSGLDALHELATMPIDVNSAQNQVKLAAAARLAGTVEVAGGGGLEETLRELNAQYQSEAPRLRVTRERLTVETLPPERIVVEGG